MAGCQALSISRQSDAALTPKSYLQIGGREVHGTIFKCELFLEEKLGRAGTGTCNDIEDLPIKWRLPKAMKKLRADVQKSSWDGKLPNNGSGKNDGRIEETMCNIIIMGANLKAKQPNELKRLPNSEEKAYGVVSSSVGCNSLNVKASLKEVLPKSKEEALNVESIDGESVGSTGAGNGQSIVWDDLTLEEAVSSLESSIYPSPPTERIISFLLKCRKEGSHANVSSLHTYVRQRGLLSHPFFGNHLVVLLSEAGMLSDAQQVFDGLSHCKRQSWNCLITSYAGSKKPQQALDLYQRMQTESFISPDSFTFVSLMKACAELRDWESACKLHDHILSTKVLETDAPVGNALVNMYVNFKMLAKAQEVFDQLPLKNVVTWNTLITGYAKYGHGKEALQCLEQMELEGTSPNDVTYICSLKACGKVRDMNKGFDLHVEITRKGLLETNVRIGSALLDMYAKGGLPMKAQEVFDMLPARNIVTWNALIAGYIECNLNIEALECWERLQHEGIMPNAITFISCLKACGSTRAIAQGRKIHNQIIRSGSLDKDPIVGSALVNMYAKCGLLVKAQEVFDKLSRRNVISWTALMFGYAEQAQGEEALDCFKQMQLEGICPNAVAFACSLKACSSIGDIREGQELHAEIARRRLLDDDSLLGSTLVDMYAKCGSLSKAREVFDTIATRNIVLWNSLLTGYLDHGCCKDALLCFERMQLEGDLPDAVTYVCGLKACSTMGDISKGHRLHSQIIRECSLKGWLAAGNALVDMYAKSGLLVEAQDVFDELPAQDVVTWNALLAGYAQSEIGEEALTCFEDMKMEGFSPDVITYDSMLRACGSIGAAEKGQEIHATITKDENLELDSAIGNALVGMYAKCGLLNEAQGVFNSLLVRDVVMWTTLIAGYAQVGESGIVFEVFSRMLQEGVKPNMVTYVGVLNACSHAGLIEKGKRWFEAMCTFHDIAPVTEHYTCVIDLLCRAGQLEFALSIIMKMPLFPDAVALHALLGACKHRMNVGLGRHLFEQVVQNDQYNASAYISMYNIYADAELREESKDSLFLGL